jgi:N-hydroxyarylamine O-acetyltransferase
MDGQAVTAYLRRIGAERPPVLDETALGVLHRAHLLAVPFENLSIHLAEPISLAEDHLIDKIVTRRRGGFCYELNGAFAALLQALGAQVVRVAARVYGDGGPGPPFDHLALVVRPANGSGPWLADVGFGSHSTYPLRYDRRDDQDDPGGRFQLADTPDGDVNVLRDGQPQYRIERRERSLADFAPDLLVAADLAGVPLHPQHDLLPPHRGRPDLHQRPDPDPDQRRVTDRAAASHRRRRAGRLP